MGGSERVEIREIPAGRTHTHDITVQAARPGRFELASTNFSYRDEDDTPVRVSDFLAGLTVSAAPPPVVIRQPAGRLDVSCEGGALSLGEWDVLRIMVSNRTGVRLHNVTVAVDGPFQGDGKLARITVLEDGAAARFPFSVNASQGGRHVPVNVHLEYGHLDGNGTLQTRKQEDVLHLAVGSPASESPPGEQTILYLAASPPALPPLRSDLEMRKVKERLQLAKHRDRYRIEPYLAVRFDDISQALIDFEPQVVHFSGHGDSNGMLCIEDESGQSTLATPEGLAELFGQHKSTIRCVVVNACHSVRLAEALASRIDHVIGMRYQIGDAAAIEFSVGFYLALFAGWSVPDAFVRGRSHIRSRAALEQEHLTPLIFPPLP
jgi:hypothetical protein